VSDSLSIHCVIWLLREQPKHYCVGCVLIECVMVMLDCMYVLEGFFS